MVRTLTRAVASSASATIVADVVVDAIVGTVPTVDGVNVCWLCRVRLTLGWHSVAGMRPVRSHSWNQLRAILIRGRSAYFFLADIRKESRRARGEVARRPGLESGFWSDREWDHPSSSISRVFSAANRRVTRILATCTLAGLMPSSWATMAAGSPKRTLRSNARKVSVRPLR